MKYHHIGAIGITGVIVSLISNVALPAPKVILSSIGMTMCLLAMVLFIAEWLHQRRQ